MSRLTMHPIVIESSHLDNTVGKAACRVSAGTTAHHKDDTSSYVNTFALLRQNRYDMG